MLRLFGRELPLAKTGAGRFVTRPPQGQTPRTVAIRFGDDGRAESVQFAVWAFARVAPAPP